jgi:hypothetical protein
MHNLPHPALRNKGIADLRGYVLEAYALSL